MKLVYNKTHKIFMAMIILLLSSVLVSATMQEGDLIVVNGHRYYSAELPRLVDIFPNKEIPAFSMISTGNNKGYRATWAIAANKLYLIGVEGMIRGDESKRLHRSNEIFPQITFPYHVTKYSGTIKLIDCDEDYMLKNGELYHTISITVHIKDGVIKSIKRNTVKETHGEDE